VRLDTWFTSQIRVPLLHILFFHTCCSVDPSFFLLAMHSCTHTCTILHWSKYKACDTWLTSHISFLTRVAQLSRPIILLAMHSYTHYSKTNLRLDTWFTVQIWIPLLCIPFSSHLLPSRSIHHLFLLAIHSYTNYYTHTRIQLQLQNLYRTLNTSTADIKVVWNKDTLLIPDQLTASFK